MAIMRDKKQLFNIPDPEPEDLDGNNSRKSESALKGSSALYEFLPELKWEMQDKANITENSEVKYNCDTDSSSSDTKVSINDK